MYSDFIGLVRSELYSQTDFLTICVGVFGLFMGISVISLVEIIYYFTLRLSFIVWDYRWHIRKLKGLVNSIRTNISSKKMFKSAGVTRVITIKRRTESKSHTRPSTA